MDEDDYRVKSFMEVTGASPQTAINFMYNSRYHINVAIDAFYDRYAPITAASSDEFSATGIEIDDNGNFTQKRGKKRQQKDDNDCDPLIISSDEEDEVVFISEHKNKVPKLELAGCASTSKPTREHPATPPTATEVKRKILIDGSNVAVTYAKALHGKNYNKHSGDAFSVEGLEICVKHFKAMGFEVRAIVPEYRLQHNKSSNCQLIQQMREEGILVATPAKAYDDEILLKGAVKLDAAVVSNDFFRDFKGKGKGFDDVINNRVIRYNFVFNELILAEDPYGRAGPKLKDILYSRI